MITTTTITTRRLSVIAASAAAMLMLAGCSSAAQSEESEAAASDTITIDDAWVKAADEGMSAGFGDIRNSGDEDVTVVSVTTAASSMLELHETVENEAGQMVMREKQGGFVIPSSGDLQLEPGGNHIMLMDLVDPLLAGDEVAFTLTFSDDSTYDFTAPVKDYSGANENYEGGDMDMDMDMGGDE